MPVESSQAHAAIVPLASSFVDLSIEGQTVVLTAPQSVTAGQTDTDSATTRRESPRGVRASRRRVSLEDATEHVLGLSDGLLLLARQTARIGRHRQDLVSARWLSLEQWEEPAQATTPRTWLASCEAYVDELRRLPDNWDADGAVAPCRATRNRFVQMLRRVHNAEASLPKPDILPAPDGSLQAEFDMPGRGPTPGRELDLEVPPDAHQPVRYLKVHKPRDPVTQESRIDLYEYDEGTVTHEAQMLELVRWVLASYRQ